MKIHLRMLLVLAFSTVAVAGCERAEKHDQESHGEDHGPPKDWKFTLAKGDAAEGRIVFVELQCYKCHEVKGESFPDMAPDEKGIGPELSQMAGVLPIEFFAEAIANPNAVIDEDAKERGHIGDDGRSKMPEFADVISVKQLADLATYLASLSGGQQKR